MKVILIGAGRYGNNLVGPKYANNDYFGAKIEAVVDPNIDIISKADNYNLKNAIPYKDISDIKITDPNNTVAEVALTPQVIPKIFDKIIDKGISKIILPKPVSSNYAIYETFLNKTKEMNTSAVVTSNWHYSEITGLLKAILSKTKSNSESIDPKIAEKYASKLDSIPPNLSITNIEIEYSKKDEVLTIPPPSQELPHVLQILHSTGLCDFEKKHILMNCSNQNSGKVNLLLMPINGHSEKIYINSDLKKGDKTTLPRERIVKIDLVDKEHNIKAKIIADYDAKFVNSKCEKPASIYFECTDNKKNFSWKQEIIEDNMDTMYKSIYSFFNNKTSDALTLEKYAPVAKMISRVQRVWDACNKFKSKWFKYVTTKPAVPNISYIKKIIRLG